MRLDKYLKVSRLIKRRTVANDACDAGRVMVNDKVVKASYDVKVGDIIEIQFGNKNVRARVTDVKDTVKYLSNLMFFSLIFSFNDSICFPKKLAAVFTIFFSLSVNFGFMSIDIISTVPKTSP